MLQRTPYLYLCSLVLNIELLGYIADMLSRMIVLIYPFISCVRVRASERVWERAVTKGKDEGCCCWAASVVSDSLWSMDCSLPRSSVHDIFQARILGWVVISSSRWSCWPRDRTQVSHSSFIGRQILNQWATWEAFVSLYVCKLCKYLRMLCLLIVRLVKTCQNLTVWIKTIG